MKVYAITDIGRMRPINEDSYYLPLEGERFCAVADGMGGHNAGEVASALAVQVFSEQMRGVETITAEALHDAVEKANEAVYHQALENASMSGMGTTFSALVQQGETVYLAHGGAVPSPAQHHHPRAGHRGDRADRHRADGRAPRRRLLPVQRRHDQLCGRA